MSRFRSRFFTSPGKVPAAVLAAAGFVLFVSSSALSQGPPRVCYPRDHLLSWLQENYGEVPIGFGVTDGRLIELLTSEDGTTWTIILTSPDGMSCMMTGGEAWRQLPQSPAV